MTLDINEVTNGKSIDIKVVVTLDDNIPSDCVIYLTACQNDIFYGGKYYNFLNRCENDQYPIIHGESLGISGSGQSTTFNETVDLDSLAYGGGSADEMYLIAWVQDPTTKEVLQAGQLYDPPTGYNAIESASIGGIKAIFK